MAARLVVLVVVGLMAIGGHANFPGQSYGGGNVIVGGGQLGGGGVSQQTSQQVVQQSSSTQEYHVDARDEVDLRDAFVALHRPIHANMKSFRTELLDAVCQCRTELQSPLEFMQLMSQANGLLNFISIDAHAHQLFGNQPLPAWVRDNLRKLGACLCPHSPLNCPVVNSLSSLGHGGIGGGLNVALAGGIGR